MRWGLSGRTPEFSVWVLVLGVLIVVVIGQQQQHPPQQQPHVEPNLGEPRGSSHHPLTSITGTDPTLADQLSQSPPNTRTSQSAQTKASGDNIEVLEASLLKVFGMRRRPRPTGKAHVPQYLLDLYRQHSSDTNDDVSLNFNVRGTPTHSANTVRSFYHKDNRRAAESVDEHNSGVLEYDVDTIPDHETITAAELRLYRHAPRLPAPAEAQRTREEDTESHTRDSENRVAVELQGEHGTPKKNARHYHTNLQDSASPQELVTDPTSEGGREVDGEGLPHEMDSLLQQKHRIDVYEVMRPATRTSEAITRLIDTRVVSPRAHSRWESFDVHPAVLKWRQAPHKNYGLEVRVTTADGQSSPLQHVRLKRSTGMQETQWLSEQPLLVTYSDDGRAAPRASSPASQRTRKRRSSRHKKRSRSHHAYSRKKKQQYCKRYDLYVDFSDVGWDDWIVAPPGYHAYYCHGNCDMFPLPEYINTTNHAIVQSLVHSKNPKAVPLPCCVPTELTSISMLYLDEYEKVVLKNYQDMVVQGCGCR